MTDMLLSILLAFAWLFPSELTTPSENFIVELTEQQYPHFVEHWDEARIQYALSRIATTDYYRFSIGTNIGATRDLRIMELTNMLMRWQHDRPVIPRNTPNDPLFPNQWDMTRIGMQEAWNQATGA